MSITVKCQSTDCVNNDGANCQLTEIEIEAYSTCMNFEPEDVD